MRVDHERWGRVAALALLGLALCGCAGASRPAQAPPGPEPRAVAWDCAPGPGLLTTFADDGTMLLEGPDGSVLFQVAISASGARYVAPGRQFWIKGQEARYEVGGTEALCREDRRRSWAADARRRGATLRATGNEPGWVLEIGPERLFLLLDYGATLLEFPAAPPEEAADGAGRVWRSRAGGRSLEALVEHRPCADDMSGEAFDHAVRLVLDGSVLRGCGGEPW